VRTRHLRICVLILAFSMIMPIVPAAAGDAEGDDSRSVPMLDIIDPRLLNSTYTSRIPIIDGVLDDLEWGLAEGTEALYSKRPPAWEETGSHISGPGIQNDSDASHRFWSMYDEDYLYFGFNCSDDIIIVDNYPGMFYRDDGIEIAIDGALDHDEDQRTDPGFEDGDTFSIPADGSEGIAYSIAEGNQYARYWGPNRDWFSAVNSHSVNNTTWYIVEVAIRLSAISNPLPGGMVGLNTGQNDDDNGNTTKEGVIRWQGLDGYEAEVFKNETLWGHLYFKTAVRADAGYNKVINQTESVTFDGSRSWSNHPNFTQEGTYTWTFMYNGELQTLNGKSPSFTFDLPGEYVVTLNVSDGTNVWDTDTVSIGVRDTEDPVARAGPDRTVEQGEVVTLDGSGSTDNHPDFPDGFEFEWFFIDGKVVRLNGLVAEHTFNTPGVYTIRLTVTDPSGNTNDDSFTITVKDVEPPYADAGEDITVDDGQLVNFDGTNSTDNYEIVKMVWEFMLGEDSVNLTGRSPKYTFPTPGVYNVTLTVYDADGQTDSDSMTVTVIDVTPPIADAGDVRAFNEDVEVILETLTSYDNVGIVSYKWEVFYGLAKVFEATTKRSSYTFSEPGLYQITLTVTDGVGLMSEDTVQYSVKDVTPPLADAGEDQEVDEDVPITFSGAGSSDNVAIEGWEWVITADEMPTVRRTGEEFEYVFIDPGVYTATLTVTDKEGAFDSDTVQITVEDVTAPEAVAPSSVTIKTGQVMEFDGRQSEDNVDITKYHWHYEMAGAPFDLFGPNITVPFDSKGNFTFTLTVEDAAGNTDTASFYVNVEKPKTQEEPGFGLLIALVAVAAVATAMVARRRD
jgi:PKD repeat protein